MPQRNLIIIGIAAVALILALAGGYFFIQSQKPTTPTVQPPIVTTNTQAITPSPSSQKSSLKSLMDRGGNTTCTVNQPEGNGTIFVADKKFAGDFVTNVEGKDILSHIVYDGATTYIWSDNQTTGFKMKVDPSQIEEQAQNQKTVDLNKEVDVDCKNWSVDNTKFTPPANITFTDLSNFVPSKTTTTGSPNLSAACDQLTDPAAKKACINALKGNQ